MFRMCCSVCQNYLKVHNKTPDIQINKEIKRYYRLIYIIAK